MTARPAFRDKLKQFAFMRARSTKRDVLNAAIDGVNEALQYAPESSYDLPFQVNTLKVLRNQMRALDATTYTPKDCD